MPLQKNEIISLTIDTISSDGNGLGRYNGQAVFVPYTAVGDVLRVKIVKPCASYAFGIIDSIDVPGAGRVPSGCGIYTKCGGCCMRHMNYAAELQAKQCFVADAMQRIGGVSVPVSPILASPQENGYRNKVQYPLTVDENGNVCAGFLAGRSHRVIPCPSCALQPDILTDIVNSVCALLTRFHVSVYREEAHKGLLRHIYLRHAVTTGKVMVCLVLCGKNLPHCAEIVQELTADYPCIETILLNINTKNTNVILGEECLAVYGNGLLQDTLSGVPVQLHPLSFYQVNTRGAEQLYAVAAKLADIKPEDTLLDLYCGAGTIGLSMARQCKKLIGVEIVPAAIESAKNNAAAMGIQHAEFFCADAGAAAQKLEQDGLRPDVIILDPPRKGCDNDTLQAVLHMQPCRIVMVSCNAATAARDVKTLCTNTPYTVKAIQPVDMFPRTKHVETVVLMSRKDK